MENGINLNKTSEYRSFLSDLKKRIHNSQMRAALSANKEMIELYWHIGLSVINLQKEKSWGNAVVEQLSEDLKNSYPGITGFSRTNLFAMRQMVLFFLPYITTELSNNEVISTNATIVPPKATIVPQLVGLLPWGHIRVLISKIKDYEKAVFYIKNIIEYGWSRDVLLMQIEQNLYEREGKAVTNFKNSLPYPQSDLAQQTLKDPYMFDFLTLEKNVQERQIEKSLIRHITQFLLELGKGFAYIGNQYHLQVNEKDYYLDLLFYHVKLKCYVVIELKSGEFKPEYAGKINFYLSAVDDLLRSETDNPSIGIILCKNKDRLDVEYALRDINKPIGVSSFTFKEIPTQIKHELPTVEQIEEEFSGLDQIEN